MKKPSLIGRGLTVAAALAFATPGVAQPTAVAEALSPAEAELATDEELQQARGGWVWVVVIAGARASQIAIRMCASKTDSCARGAAAVFTSASAARRWVCNRYGRFC